MKRTLILMLTVAFPLLAQESDPESNGRKLSEWTRILRTGQDEERLAAIRAMQMLGNRAKSAVPTLTTALGDQVPDIRYAAGNALVSIRPDAKDIVPKLIQMTRSETLEDIQQVLRVLCSYAGEDPSAKSTFMGMLRSRNERTCIAALNAFTGLMSPPADAAPALLQAVTNHPGLAYSVTYALRRTDADPKTVVPTFLKLLKSTDPNARRGALFGLGAYVSESEQALRAVRTALAAKDQSTRQAALGGLSQAKYVPASFVEALKAAMREEDMGTRASAVQALGLVGEKAQSAVPLMVRLLEVTKAEDYYTRQRVVDAIGRIGPGAASSALPTLRKLIKDDNSYVRQAAVSAIGRMGEAAKAAVPDLVFVLNSPTNDYMRAAAARALGAIGKNAKDAIPDLERLSGRQTMLGSAAAEALDKIKADIEGTAVAAKPETSGEAKKPDVPPAGPETAGKNPEQSTGPEAPPVAPIQTGLASLGLSTVSPVGELEKVLQHKDLQVRREAVLALGSAGKDAKPVIASLAERLKDDEVTIRRDAAWAIGAIGGEPKEVLPKLTGALKEEPAAVKRTAAWALGALGPAAAEAVPSLIEALKAEDEMVRWMAAWSLGAIGSKLDPVVAALTEAEKDESRAVKEAAAEALARLKAKPQN
jgi:HEAT repeat protein